MSGAVSSMEAPNRGVLLPGKIVGDSTPLQIKRAVQAYLYLLPRAQTSASLAPTCCSPTMTLPPWPVSQTGWPTFTLLFYCRHGFYPAMIGRKTDPQKDFST